MLGIFYLGPPIVHIPAFRGIRDYEEQIMEVAAQGEQTLHCPVPVAGGLGPTMRRFSTCHNDS